MRLVVEEIDGPIYIDVVISPEELEKMRFGEMIDTSMIASGYRFYVGVRMDSTYEKEDYWPEED